MRRLHTIRSKRCADAPPSSTVPGTASKANSSPRTAHCGVKEPHAWLQSKNQEDRVSLSQYRTHTGFRPDASRPAPQSLQRTQPPEETITKESTRTRGLLAAHAVPESAVEHFPDADLIIHIFSSFAHPFSAEALPIALEVAKVWETALPRARQRGISGLRKRSWALLAVAYHPG